MSNADSRSTVTDALETLGSTIDENAGRDAIHIAVEPVVALESLKPGQHVGLVDGGASQWAETKLGIVDPFLRGPVAKGDRFWLMVYPRTITSLRHVWTHPGFAEEVAEPAIVAEPSKDASVKWMMAWAMEHMSEDYYGDRDKLTSEEALGNAIQAGHSHHIGPYESARDHIDGEWWGHWEAITGVKGSRDSYFSCGC